MELDLELDVVQQEPTVLEYARFHGICRDYTQEPLLLDCVFSLSPDILDADLQDPKNGDPPTNPADELTKERLAVGKEAAMLLKSLQSLRNATPEPIEISNGRKCLQGLKQEVPILHTDEELDMLEFGSSVEIGFTDLRIPLEPVNQEADEGLDWPARYIDFPEQCLTSVKHEKLAISRDVLLYLHDTTKDSHVSDFFEVVREERLNYRKNIAIRSVTPPLLPPTPVLSPYIPSSPGNYLPLVSDDSNSTAAEAKALEERIMDTDVLMGHDSDGSDFVLLDTNGADEYDTIAYHEISPRVKRKASDLKVEGPLTPPMFSDPPTKKLKAVAFADVLVEYIPTAPGNENVGNEANYISCKDGEDSLDLPSNFEDGNDILTEDDDYVFYKTIEPVAEDANWQIENEKLLEADTTKRMDVPHLDFRLPTAPWEEFACSDVSEAMNAQDRFIQWVKRNHMRSVTSWHGVSELDRKLPLAPFSYASSKFVMEEKLHGEEIVTRMLASITDEGIATSSTDMWKRAGLRILEDDEGEEEEEDILERHEPEKKNDMNSLINKRMIELQENADVENIAHRTNGSKKSIDNKQPYYQREAPSNACWKSYPTLPSANQTARSIDHRSKPMHTRESNTSLMFGGKFSATSALDKFMALNGKGTSSTSTSQKKTVPDSRLEIEMQSSIQPTHQVHKGESTVANEGLHSGPKVLQQTLDLPKMPAELPSCSFVISSAFLQRRSLAKQIQSLYPDAEFVSRDFDVQCKDSEEADLILSPSTGLIIATIQQLKQRALPGQPARSPIKDRIMALQAMYERLIILVSEGLSKEWEGQSRGECLDQRDQEALDEYKNFASQLEGEILVRYVPGGDQALARTAVNEMAQFGLPHGSQDIGDIKLLTDQTTWELFLRRAGLNAFAAQVVLALLKDPITWPDNSHGMQGTFQTYGLQTFLLMSAEQRAKSFQTVLGGSRVLARVSKLLDEPWPSAAHEFRM